MSTDPLKIIGEDHAIIQETLRAGDLNIFASRHMWLPHSGTMWLPEDAAVDDYRNADFTNMGEWLAPARLNRRRRDRRWRRTFPARGAG